MVMVMADGRMHSAHVDTHYGADIQLFQLNYAAWRVFNDPSHLRVITWQHP